MALLEPASLDREDLSTLMDVRQKYRHASKLIHDTGDVELGVGVVYGWRVTQIVVSIQWQKQQHNLGLLIGPFGFAYALDAVTDHVEVMVNEPELRRAIIDASEQVFLFSGELSHEALKQHMSY